MNIFGGGTSGAGDAATQAAQLQYQSTQQAAQLAQQQSQQAQQNLQPWLNTGKASLATLGGLFGVGGYAPINPTAQLQSTPGYQWGLNQGIGAMSNYAASIGQTGSGAMMKGVNDWAQNYATQTAWQPYVNQLNLMSGQGLQAGTQSGNFGMEGAQMQGQDIMAGGQAQAQGIWNQALLNQAAQQRQQQGVGGLLGMGAGVVGSVLGGPMGGMIGSGIGNWLGNLGYQGT